MNTQEIIENNAIIARYDGLQLPLSILDYAAMICRDNGRYHKSFDWLMPVLNKIEKSGCIIEINYALIVTCRICYLGKNMFDKACNFYGDNNGGKEPIMAIYECVVEFLKYLENEKGNNK